MKQILIRILAAIFFMAGRLVEGQGTFRFAPTAFQNLDFESALVTPVPVDKFGGVVSAADAIPGWTPYYGANLTPGSNIHYNDISGGGDMISLYGPDWRQPSQILGGRYSLEINTDFIGAGTKLALGQTAQIPQSSKALLFRASPNSGGMTLSFAGQVLPLLLLGGTASYNIFGADVSSFAGQTAELRFSFGPQPGAAILDDLQFSSQAVPEPSALSILAAGVLFLSAVRRIPSRKK